VENLFVVVLLAFIPACGYVCYWAGKNSGERNEYRKHESQDALRRERLLRMDLEIQNLRRERDGLADELGRFWRPDAQKSGDYVE
jgi:hypothetical protein